MLFLIILFALILAATLTVIKEYLDGRGSAEVVGAVAATLTIGTIIGGTLLLVIGSFHHINRDDEGWSLQKESVYTVAEGSDVEVEHGTIEFVAVMDGTPRGVSLDDGYHMVYERSTEGPRTVTIREEFRDVGTAIFPWGEGDIKTTAIIK